jgi:hypothetical protein
MALGLSIASWTCFIVGALSIKSPSPLLIGLFPAHFLFGLAAFFAGGGKKWLNWLNAALLCANYAFLYKQVFLG